MTPIESLHSAYVEITGMEPKLAVHERAFMDFLEHGFTLDDWRLVLLHLRRENRRMNGAAYSLRLDKLLDFDYHRLDSFLAEAKAVARNRVVKTPQQRALQEWRGLPGTETKTETTTTQPAREMVKTALAKLSEEL